MESLLTQTVPAPIPSGALVASYRHLCMRCVNALKTDMNHDCRFDNVKSKRCSYCVDKKESCVPVSTPNFFSAPQPIRYPPDSGPVLIIAVASRLRCTGVRCSCQCNSRRQPRRCHRCRHNPHQRQVRWRSCWTENPRGCQCRPLERNQDPSSPHHSPRD